MKSKGRTKKKKFYESWFLSLKRGFQKKKIEQKFFFLPLDTVYLIHFHFNAEMKKKNYFVQSIFYL